MSTTLGMHMLLYVDSQFVSPYATSVFVSLLEKQLAFEIESVDLAADADQEPAFAATSITRRVPRLIHGSFPDLEKEESMFGVHDFWLFLFAGCLLNVTPGPDIAYIVARSAQCGVRGGVAAAFGITAGCLVHIAAAAIGVSAILMTSALAFNVLKWIGAAYLVYVGFKMLFASRRRQESPQSSMKPPAAVKARTIFFQGFLTNVLNPKVALFFLAFLPQFIRSDASSKAMAFVILGLVFASTGTVWNLIVAWSAGRLATAWSGLGRMRQWLEKSLGVLFVGLGVRLALSDAR